MYQTGVMQRSKSSHGGHGDNDFSVPSGVLHVALRSRRLKGLPCTFSLDFRCDLIAFVGLFRPVARFIALLWLLRALHDRVCGGGTGRAAIGGDIVAQYGIERVRRR